MERGINRGRKNGRDSTGHPQLIEFRVQAPTDFKGMAWGHELLQTQVGEELVNEKSCGKRGRRAQQRRVGASRGLISAPRGPGEKREYKWDGEKRCCAYGCRDQWRLQPASN